MESCFPCQHVLYLEFLALASFIFYFTLRYGVWYRTERNQPYTHQDILPVTKFLFVCLFLCGKTMSCSWEEVLRHQWCYTVPKLAIYNIRLQVNMVKSPWPEITEALVDPSCISEVQGIKMPYKYLCLYNRLVLLSALTKKFLCSVCNDCCRHSWMVIVVRMITESSARDMLMIWTLQCVKYINEYIQTSYENFISSS